MKRILSLVLALMAISCERSYRPEYQSLGFNWKKGPVYAAWQEGLTFIYEDPRLASDQRFQNREQLRVSKVVHEKDQAVVTYSYTSLRKSPSDKTLILKNGGVSLVVGPNQVVMDLPEGFPDKAQQWESHGVLFRVQGRAAANLPGLVLPDTRSSVGVWVEAVPASKHIPRTRVFYMEGIGKAEMQVWKNDRWESIARLVSMGRSDPPVSSKSENKSE